MAATIPIFDGENYKFWNVKMKTLFQSLELWDMVENGYHDENNRENQKKNAEALSLIQRCVSDSIFKTIMNDESAKDAWDFLQGIFRTEERPTLSMSFSQRILPSMRAFLQEIFRTDERPTPSMSFSQRILPSMRALAKALTKPLVPANISKSKETNLIVATLIATVTFAAGITMPGGYVNDNKDPNQGMAILTRKTAFKTFVITDTIALSFSSFAVLTHLYTSMTDNPILLKLHLTFAFVCTAYAMIAMLVAFITGTYAVLASSSLSIFVWVIPSSMLFTHLLYSNIVFPLLMYQEIQRLSRPLPRVQNQ